MSTTETALAPSIAPSASGAAAPATGPSGSVPKPRKGETLTQDARGYLGQLIAEYRVLQSATMNAGAKAVANEIVARFRDPKQANGLAAPDLYAFEIALTALKPVEKLRRDALNLRSRYRQTVGEAAYAVYVASGPPELKKAAEADLRADIEYLLGQIHWYHNFVAAREKLRTHVSAYAMLVTVGACALLLAWVGWQFNDFYQRPGPAAAAHLTTRHVLPLVILAGALGGFMSVQRRIQTTSCEGDPLMNTLALRFGQASVWLSPISGAVFAVLLYLIFAGGLLSGALFPEIRGVAAETANGAVAAAQPTAALTLGSLLGAVPTGIGAFTKVLIWSFVAGFAERFVPDTLDRLIHQEQQGGHSAVAPATAGAAAGIAEFAPARTSDATL